MQNKKIIQPERESYETKDSKNILTENTLKFTTIVSDELSKMPMSTVTPYLIYFADKLNLELYETPYGFISQGDAYEVAKKMLEKSINYN